MAKEIKFNVKLVVDGKEQLVTATSTAEELRRVLDSAKTSSQKLNAALVNFNQAVMAANNVTNAISQISGALNGVTEESRSFSAAMNAANTMAGKSGEDFARLKGQVAELSKSIPVVRDELANGLYQVISNGVPEDNWIAFLQKSAKASVGGIADLGETVKVTSTIIKNYGLSWDKAGDVQDKIQLTAKNGVTSFEQLAQALPRVTGNAATLGVSIDELMATFATLTGVSGNTNEVATQMAAIFTALVKPSSEASKMAQQMGIEFDAAAIKAAGGMRNFLTDLDKNVKAYASKSGMLEQEIYGKLFGSAESLRALGPLTGQLADKFNENVEAMKGSAGTIDDAFSIMSSSGAASLQILKNKFAEVGDAIASTMGGIMPVLNITAQIGNTVIAVSAMVSGLKNLAKIQAIVKVRTMAMNAASLVWNATSVRMNALVQVMTASFRGAAVSATTLKLAIQGLLISTGVGVAIVALTEVIAAFTSKSADAQTQAEDTAESMKGFGDAADDIKTAYDSAIKNTYADLMAKYEKLKAGWRALSTEQQKMAWIKDNQSAFNELRLKIGNVAEAENIFNRKTDAVVEAFKQRALAAAYAAKLTALYQRQIELLDKKQKITKTIADDAKQGGRHAKEGDIVPESWRSDRYGKVGRDGQWRFTKVGAERYNGTNVSGNTQINSVDKEIESVNRQIGATQKQLTTRLNTARSFITAGTPTTPHAKDTPKKTTIKDDKKDEPKTHVEELQAQLAAAQKEMGNAMTVDARVKADAKVADIQRQIDEATKGKVSIGAETEPTYIVQGSDADKRQSRTNAQHNIDRIRQDFEIGLIGKEEAERQIADINKQLEKLGVKPIEVHFKTYIEELQEQLHDAQQEFEEATTIDARVKADAKIADIQRQIDETTKGKVSIKAETEPAYIVQGSAADKRQSHSNAQNKASRIQTDYEIGIIGKDEALKEIEEINRQLAEIGLKPIKIELDSKGFDKVFGDIKSGWGSIQGVGNGIQGISDALEGNGDAWQQVTGLINGFISIAEGIQGIVELFGMLTAATSAHAAASTTDAAATAGEAAAATANTAAKSGEAVANATASGAKMPFPLNLVAIAAGVAAVIAALAAVSGFATGGVIGGTSTSGDKKFARVNSGEMILNKFQQARLFGMIDGKFQPPTFTERRLQPVTMQNITNDIEPTATEVNINMNANARKILDMITDVKRVAKKSGKNYNV
ncbi:phage tail tape measure protein [Segatella copri]|uniref:Phage tail tape measure protein n=1 Tax=Segatella copri TaxID=165179 RepID=A0AA90ZSP9_9BACT|nr:phage tail tape measure protein [Segatella copri]MQN68741.1 phage tail tape measure protein [Segatella copri]MQN79034.1 phage tail tape measure protein [Segatella copri]MQO02381.1 phage tail tape measure protein [Segatella copri]